MSSQQPPPGQAPALARYRETVAMLAREFDGHAPDLEHAEHLEGLVDWLDRPDLSPVLDALGDRRELLRRAAEFALEHKVGRASTARNRAELLATFLLQQVELVWWGPELDLETLAELDACPRLRHLGSGKAVGFRYTMASDAFLPRVNGYLRRRWLTSLSPGTSSVSHAAAHPAVITLLEHIAAEFREATGETLWVNSLTRPITHQRRLQELGFTAFLPSAHCRGMAADIEAGWYEPRGTRPRLDAIVEQMVDQGYTNAINEGRIWHVCPSPAWVALDLQPPNQI